MELIARAAAQPQPVEAVVGLQVCKHATLERLRLPLPASPIAGLLVKIAGRCAPRVWFSILKQAGSGSDQEGEQAKTVKPLCNRTKG